MLKRLFHLAINSTDLERSVGESDTELIMTTIGRRLVQR